MSSATDTVARGPGRPPLPGLEHRLAVDVLEAVAAHGPVSADTLRAVVSGQARRIDQAARVLVASGRVQRVKAGYVLADGEVPVVDGRKHCQRCGQWREDMPLHEATVRDPVDAAKTLDLLLCSPCLVVMTR